MNARMGLIILVSLMSVGFVDRGGVWQKSGFGIDETDIRLIKVDPNGNNHMYVGTSSGLYGSQDGGKHYRLLLKPPGEFRGVNDIAFSPVWPEHIAAATDTGLYTSHNKGKTWERVYNSADPDAVKCLAVALDDEKIYVGTQKGLLAKGYQETSWQKIRAGIDNRPVYQIVMSPDHLAIATGQAVFRMHKKNNTVKQIFSMGIGERGREDDSGEDADLPARDIRHIVYQLAPKSVLFVATNYGIYYSLLPDSQWQKIPAHHLAVDSITSLFIQPVHETAARDCNQNLVACMSILAGTSKGVFLLNNDQWTPLYKGMATNEVNYLAGNQRGTVYAATSRGVYSLETKETLPFITKSPSHQVTRSPEDLTETDRGGSEAAPGVYRIRFKQEPDIAQVQRWAIDYAEVNQNKISGWRVLARKKALLPDLSVGLDRDATDLFHWNTGASPDELQKGRELLDWDVSMSWNLSDLIWSTDQTTIDSRSKLMVELREDILNEVTRLYFERRRLQIEFSMNGTDDWSQIDQEMRIDELTALIDALTGGKFGENIMNQKLR